MKDKKLKEESHNCDTPDIWHDGCNYPVRFVKTTLDGDDLLEIAHFTFGLYRPDKLSTNVRAFCLARFHFSDGRFIEVYYVYYEEMSSIVIKVYGPAPLEEKFKNQIRAISKTRMTYPGRYDKILNDSSIFWNNFPDKSPKAFKQLHLFFEKVQDKISNIIESDYDISDTTMVLMDIDGNSNC